MKILKREFYSQDAITAAKNLLGKYLIHNQDDNKISGKIVETEAYTGVEDRASHGFGGKITERNKAEFMIGGHIYIYLVYGMYWQLNISTGLEGIPECVLIRAVEPAGCIDVMMKKRKIEKIINLSNGPGKLCMAMGFDKSHYGLDVTKSKEVYVEDHNENINENEIISAKRIGIDYAGAWKDKLLRFYIKNNKFVSKI
ncbi:DNA-3-methyladenine glycosylase [Candidatus Poribacteria bacterium]|nr:DNA-3-methyladenine glycosylase [Candidatus Poribacteria bacterium]